MRIGEKDGAITRCRLVEIDSSWRGRIDLRNRVEELIVPDSAKPVDYDTTRLARAAGG
jgi:hypothetical protein